MLSNDTAGADGWSSGAGVVGAVKGEGGAPTRNLGNLGDEASVTIAGDHGTLTLHADGTYTYVANAASVTQLANDVFTYTVADADGDLTTATLTISVNDDVPRVTTQAGTNPRVVVDESALATTPSSAVFSSLFAIDPGADGAAATHPVLYALGLGGGSGSLSGLVDTVTGQPVTLTLSGDTITGSSAPGGGDPGGTVFTLSVDPATGEVTLDQVRAVRHPDADDHDDPLALPDEAVTLMATVTDGDGDVVASSPLDIGARIRFSDDGPSVVAGHVQHGTVDEQFLPTGSNAPATPTPVTATGSLGVVFGADGAGDVSFTQATMDALLGQGLVSGGEDLVYLLGNGGHTLTATAGDGGPVVFTVDIRNPTGNPAQNSGDPSPSYSFTLLRALFNLDGDDVTPQFRFSVADGDGDLAHDSFTIRILDDIPADSRNVTVVEDSSITFNSSADGNSGNITLPDSGTPDGLVAPAHGSLTTDADGRITYTPDADYSGADTFSYRIQDESGALVETVVNVTVSPEADAPGLPSNKTVTVAEDASISLGLSVPTVADAADRNGAGVAGDNGDNPERLGAITLTLAGNGAAGAALTTTVVGDPIGALIPLLPVGRVVTIVVTDASGSNSPSSVHAIDQVPAATANGVYYLTREEFEAIVATPAPQSHDNFSVTVAVTSHEVDDAGASLGEVAGAASSQTIRVDVQAITDPADLKIDGRDGSHTLLIDEDGMINLRDYLTVAPLVDGDGSQNHWFILTNLPVGSVINGATVTSTTQEVRVNAPGLSTPGQTLPNIDFKPPLNFSGDINQISIGLYVQDRDSDGPNALGAILSDSVSLSLGVEPVAGEVAVDPVTTAEDTSVNFLAGVRVTDRDGSEVIDSVSFTVPAGWTVVTPAATAGWSVAGDGSGGSGYTITFDATPGVALTQSAREAVLGGFIIRPPAHSSADVTISLTIATTDTSTVGGTSVSTQVSAVHDLAITVTPVAERTDTDSNGANGDDVTMNGDNAYATAGREDEWFALGSDSQGAVGGGGFPMAHHWRNEDNDAATGELTFAVLTPSLVPEGESLVGTQFRYKVGGEWTVQTYTGEPVWVPSAALDSLQVKAPPDVSGELTVTMRAGTVDHDDDAEPATLPTHPPQISAPGVVSVAVSDQVATLSVVRIHPVADAVTLALNGHASGREDAEIPLTIRPSSSDPSETFDLRIEGIPVGAVLTYGGNPVIVNGGEATISHYDHSVGIAIKPPLNSNADFVLSVYARSVDSNTALGVEDRSVFTPVRDIVVSVEGVADAAAVTGVATPPTFTEAALDGGARVTLANLVSSVTSPDSDGSETLSVRITGLAEGFTIVGAALVSAGNGGDTRVWTAPAGAMASVEIRPPANYSGTVSLQVAGVTTESDGDSHTGAATTVGFSVTPSPEGIASTSAVLVEDERAPLNLSLIHQSGDTDETMGRVFISVQDVATATGFTLYLGSMPLDVAGLTVENVGGVGHYAIPADRVQELRAQGAAHLDGDLGNFGFHYEVIDSGHGGQAAAAPVTLLSHGVFTLSATAVTDAVGVSITDISVSNPGATAVEDRLANDDADPDTVTVTLVGTRVSVNLTVASDDHDGSEQVIRALIEGVPRGVIVEDGAQIGENTWVVVYAGGSAHPIDDAGGIGIPVNFLIGNDVANNLSGVPIRMTVQAQDHGDLPDSEAAVTADTVTWNLITDIHGGPGHLPPIIVRWEYTGASATEDTSFALSAMMRAEVDVRADSVDNIFSVSLTSVPDDTRVDGMTLTSVNGVPTWTASITVPAGTSDGAANDVLRGLLDGITITPPPDSNDNNHPEGFGFDARLTAFALGGLSEVEDARADIAVVPVSDEALVTVGASDVDEGTGAITAHITVDTPKDGEHGRIVDGNLYVRVETSGGNAGGTLSLSDGTVLATQAIAGVAGVPDGDYVVLDVGAGGGSVDLVYAPATGHMLQPGAVSFHAHARTTETGAANTASVSASDTATIAIANNGVTVNDASLASDPVGRWDGGEPASADKAHAIPLTGLQMSLNDDDGSEVIDAIMLTGVPVGFLVYVGADAGSAVLANNAGGDGTTNTWVLSSGAALPAHVAILPPAHWSGTLGDLRLVVSSGETALPTHRIETFELAEVVVAPRADGLTINPTIAFGAEGNVINLNLNAAMHDPVAATSTAPDASRETTTLELTGLGAHAAFYVGDALIDPTDGDDGHEVSYDRSQDTYTVGGLSQSDLEKLGFRQAASALTDQDASSFGLQVQVTAWTVESDGGIPSAPSVTDTLDLQVTALPGTTGHDALIWGGAGKPVINARAGEDVVRLRIGEDVTGSELSAGLRSVETIDLLVAGANELTTLTLQDVFDITDGRNTLKFKGNDQDSVSLGAGWIQGVSSDGFTSYAGQLNGHTITVLIEDAINIHV